MDDDPFRPVPLPPTEASRRNARLRAAALATIPLILFLVAAVPRVWAPDLVPFGERQATYVSESIRRAPVSLAELYADPTVPPLALVDPLLRTLPSPVVAWVVLRCLLDALGVALLYLAARRLAGRGPAGLAALLYAASPTAWAAARDPAGPLGASVMAVALLSAVSVVERPTLVRGAIFGIVLGLLARSVPVGLVAVPAGAATLAIGRTFWKVGGIAALGLVLVAGPTLFAGLHRLRPDAVPTVETLMLPGWLNIGAAYHASNGYPSGATMLWNDHLHISVLTLGLIVAGIVACAWQVRQGHSVAVLAPTWMLLSWLGAALVATPFEIRALTGDSYTTQIADAAAAASNVPALCLMLALLTAIRQPFVRWGGLLGIGVLLVACWTTLDLSQVGIQRVTANSAAFGHDRGLYPLAPNVTLAWPTPIGVGDLATLREWSALADAVQEAVGRAKTDEAVLLGDGSSIVQAAPLDAMLRGRVRVRPTWGPTVLPLERETVVVRATGARQTIEQGWASSTMTVFTNAGVDTGARVETLRPRPASDWLASVTMVPDGRFVDGCTLVGVTVRRSPDGPWDVRLYWSLPAAAATAIPPGEVISVVLIGDGQQIGGGSTMVDIHERRSGELTLFRPSMSVSLDSTGKPVTVAADVLRIRLTSRQSQAIRTQAGAEVLDVPLGSVPR